MGNIFEFSGQDEEEEEEEDVLDGDDAVIQDNERSKNTALTDETHYDNSFFEKDNHQRRNKHEHKNHDNQNIFFLFVSISSIQ